MTRSPKPLFLLLCVIALAFFPLAGAAFYTELLTKVMILAIFAMSLDLLIGYTGLVSFGHAAYFGIAAYAVALLSPKYEAASLWLSLPTAILIAAAAALVIGLFALRTKGLYFIMVTLAFGQMVYFLFHDTGLGGGSDGIYLSFKPEVKIAGATLFTLGNILHFYYFVLALMVLAYFFLRALLRSPFGHALMGIKANEQRMRSLGFPVFYYQLASFTLAGALSGLAGYLSACQYGFVNPEILSWHQSGNVLLMVILGGLGTLHGAAAGAFAFVLLQEFFSSFTRHWQLLMGSAIVLLVLFLPGGLASLGQRFGKRPVEEAGDD
ncbi:MAG: branched-chain amino acid ABC transporter permease [Burkholderiales bacterium]